MNTFRTSTAELGSDDRSCTRRIEGEDKARCLPLRYGSLIYVHQILGKILSSFWGCPLSVGSIWAIWKYEWAIYSLAIVKYISFQLAFVWLSIVACWPGSTLELGQKWHDQPVKNKFWKRPLIRQKRELWSGSWPWWARAAICYAFCIFRFWVYLLLNAQVGKETSDRPFGDKAVY